MCDIGRNGWSQALAASLPAQRQPLCQLLTDHCVSPAPSAEPSRTMKYDSFIKRQFASRNQLQGLIWCTFGHVTLEISSRPNSRTPPSDAEPLSTAPNPPPESSKHLILQRNPQPKSDRVRLKVWVREVVPEARLQNLPPNTLPPATPLKHLPVTLI